MLSCNLIICEAIAFETNKNYIWKVNGCVANEFFFRKKKLCAVNILTKNIKRLAEVCNT